MLLMVGLGIVIGILIVVIGIGSTMSYEPTGCILTFGSVIFVVAWLVIVVPWMVFGG
ncbi:MAG: hypothetical protein H6632_03640 [Anaerolineales bacterium]|nr:hypothetical protein [Anaerolineales bacterium]